MRILCTRVDQARHADGVTSNGLGNASPHIRRGDDSELSCGFPGCGIRSGPCCSAAGEGESDSGDERGGASKGLCECHDDRYIKNDNLSQLVDGEPRFPRAIYRNLRNRKLFPTTKMDENPIAAAATIGFNTPSIAAGMATTL